MVYSNRFVACVLVKGQPVKELSNGEVHIPFDSEYALRLRNKNDRRAVVKIYIDGENVSGGGYVIPANDFIDIKRHHDKDRAFKFVSLDSPDAVDHGKNGPNPDKQKGLIEARFYLEKERKYTPPPVYPIYREEHHHHHHHHHHEHIRYRKPTPIWPQPLWTDVTPTTYGSGVWCGGDSKGMTSNGMNAMRSCGDQPDMTSLEFACSADQDKDMWPELSNPCQSKESTPIQDGCTVEGYSTGQNFYTTHVELEDTYTTLKIFLRGFHGNESRNLVATPAEEPRRTNKDRRLDDLERENEELRRKLAEAENQRLKNKLKELEK